MKISLDQKLCIGCGVCAKISPGIFVLDEARGVARCFCEQCEQDEYQNVREAASSCPVTCIRVEQ